MSGAAASRRPGKWAGWVAGAVVLLALAAAGTTVVSDRDVAATDLAGNPAFDARRFAESVWASRVLPLVHDHAADAATVLAAVASDADAAGQRYGHRSDAGQGAWNFIVHGSGVIRAADLQSRHATVTLDVSGHAVMLQIGPVIFGTALRDSLPFISFGQVTNQIQFAQISRELNDRASAAARDGLDLAALKPGATLEFAGAMTPGAPAQVTAITLRPGNGP
jgi:predicted lipoprotein